MQTRKPKDKLESGVYVRMTDAQRDAIDALAAELGLNASAFIRKRLDEYQRARERRQRRAASRVPAG